MGLEPEARRMLSSVAPEVVEIYHPAMNQSNHGYLHSDLSRKDTPETPETPEIRSHRLHSMGSATEAAILADSQDLEHSMKPIQVPAKSDNGIKRYDIFNIGCDSAKTTSMLESHENEYKSAAKHPKLSGEHPLVGFF